MGADWYTCLSFFGYEVEIPKYTNYAKLYNDWVGLNDVLEEPFKFTGILQEFHSRMEGMTQEEQEEFNEQAHLVIGFYLTNDFKEMAKLADRLSEYITEMRPLKELSLSKTPKIYSGIEWISHIEADDYESDRDDDYTDEDEEDDEDDEDDEEQDDDDEDDEEEEEEEDEEEEEEEEEEEDEEEDKGEDKNSKASQKLKKA